MLSSSAPAAHYGVIDSQPGMPTLMSKRCDVVDRLSQNRSSSHPQDAVLFASSWSQHMNKDAKKAINQNRSATSIPAGSPSGNESAMKKLKNFQKKQTQPGDIGVMNSIATCPGTLVVIGAVSAALIVMAFL